MSDAFLNHMPVSFFFFSQSLICEISYAVKMLVVQRPSASLVLRVKEKTDAS